MGANADMLADGCGIIVPVGDVEAMVAAIEKMADAGIRSEMSKCAVSKVGRQYETGIIAQKFRTYYETGEELQS